MFCGNLIQTSIVTRRVTSFLILPLERKTKQQLPPICLLCIVFIVLQYNKFYLTLYLVDNLESHNIEKHFVLLLKHNNGQNTG